MANTMWGKIENCMYHKIDGQLWIQIEDKMKDQILNDIGWNILGQLKEDCNE